MNDVGAATLAPTQSFLIDADRRVVASEGALLAAGDVVEPSSSILEAVCDAVKAAAGDGSAQQRLAMDSARGAYTLISAEVTSRSPFRAKVQISDVTAAVAAYRDALLASLVHSCQNAVFGIGSLVETMAVERPSAEALDEFLGHLREPADRISRVMTALAASTASSPLSRSSVVTSDLVAAVMARVDPRCVPEPMTIAEPGLALSVDIPRVVDAIVALLESGGVAKRPSLALERVVEGDRALLRITTVRRAPIAFGQRAVAAIWDVAGGPNLKLQSGLAAARATALAHGGDVFATKSDADVRLGFRLPIVSAR